jgi:hypothetical protein
MSTTHRVTTSIALALALAGSAATASARPFNVTSSGTYTPVNVGSPASGAANAAPTIVRVSAPSGFSWGDAGIGAAGGLGLSIAGLGGGLVLSNRRARRTHRSTAVAS